jgi:hypothetical protein
MTAKLKLVEEGRIDIAALNRADVGDPERWAKVHISGDRAKPFLWERVKRTWIR